MAREIQLTQGLVAVVDDSDFESLSQHKWYAMEGISTFYAMCNIQTERGRRPIAMHVAIMGGINVDHKDLDGLNNRRQNLRFATSSQNKMNSRGRFNRHANFKGIERHGRKWRAYVKVAGKKLYVGTSTDEAEAAKLYDAAAREHYGEFARPNFLKEGEPS